VEKTTVLRKIEYLADSPESITEVAQWYKIHWGERYTDRSLEDWAKQLALNKNSLPTTLVIFEETNGTPELVGTASLQIGGTSQANNHTVWLSGVYVVPQARHKGIDTDLIKHCIELCETLLVDGKIIDKVMLFTRTSGQLYQKLGWTLVDKLMYQGTEVLLMERNIGEQT
jgi:predicted GNAT family acetyltransferase